MNTSASNFAGQKPTIDPKDAVMLLIDHQIGLFQTVGDMAMPSLRAHAAALAKMAPLAEIVGCSRWRLKASAAGAAPKRAPWISIAVSGEMGNLLQ